MNEVRRHTEGNTNLILVNYLDLLNHSISIFCSSTLNSQVIDWIYLDTMNDTFEFKATHILADFNFQLLSLCFQWAYTEPRHRIQSPKFGTWLLHVCLSYLRIMHLAYEINQILQLQNIRTNHVAMSPGVEVNVGFTLLVANIGRWCGASISANP